MTSRAAFTLVELVIVVLILGILAAVAAPKFLNTSEAAAESTVKQSLAVLRDAIARHKAENGAWPAELGSSGDFRNDIHPYLAAGKLPPAPLGPAKGDNRVRVKEDGDPLSGANTPGRAWKYDNQTGQLIFNYKGVSSDGVTQYDEF